MLCDEIPAEIFVAIFFAERVLDDLVSFIQSPHQAAQCHVKVFYLQTVELLCARVGRVQDGVVGLSDGV